MKTFKTSREFAATQVEVFAAISTPSRLARWWGPKGFTNTFECCDFKENGRWIFTMHGPDGKNYHNENVFKEIIPNKKIVINHACEPHFQLSITLTTSKIGTLLVWEQTFENDEVAKKVGHIVVPANEQNLDRLNTEVLNK